MEKYAKHFILTTSGGCLVIAGAILWQVVASAINWDRLTQSSNIGLEISRAGMWPFAIIGTVVTVVGIFFIAGVIINLLTRE